MFQEGRYQLSVYCLSDDDDIKGYDRRTPELSSALPHMKQDTTIVEQ